MSEETLLAKKIGENRNQQADAFAEKVERRREREQMFTKDLVIVDNYDMERQLVDVVPMNEPEAPLHTDVPVLSALGNRIDYIDFDTIQEDGIGNATTGWLFWPMTDGTLAYEDRSRTEPATTDRKHQGWGEFFLPREGKFKTEPSANVLADDPASAGDRDTLVRGDDAIVWNPGTDQEAFWMVKEDGTHVVKFPPDANVFIGSTDKSVEDGDFKSVLRDGDGSIGSSTDDLQVG